MDLVADDCRAQELHRPRHVGAAPPGVAARVVDPDLAQLLLPAPAAERPDLAAEDDRAEAVVPPRQRRLTLVMVFNYFHSPCRTKPAQ